MASELHPLRFELEIWLSRLPWAPQQTDGALNWKFCKVCYPVGIQKPDTQMRTFLTGDFFLNAFIF